MGFWVDELVSWGCFCGNLCSCGFKKIGFKNILLVAGF
jgi:hypothetical protein